MFCVIIKLSKYVICLFISTVYFFRVQANSHVDALTYSILDDSTKYNKYVEKAYVLLRNQDYDRALLLSKKLLNLQIAALGANSKKVANTKTLLGRIFWLKNEFDSSLFYLQSSLHIKRKLFGEISIQVANAHNVIGIVLWSKGQYDLAFEQYKTALKLSIESLGDNHPKSAGYYHNIGILLTDRGTYGLALEYLNHALTLTASTDHLPKTNVLQSIGIVYRKQKKFEMSLQYLFEALDIVSKFKNEDTKLKADYYNSIGMVYLESNDDKQALKYFEKSLIIYNNLFGESHSGTATIYNNLGIATSGYSEKIKFLTRALNIRFEILGLTHPEVVDSFNELATTEYNQGHFAKAINYYQKAIDANFLKTNSSTFYLGILNCLDCISMVKSFNGKSKSFWALYKNNGNLTNLEAAWSNFESCDTIMYHIQKQYRNPDDRAEYWNLISEINKFAIQIVWEFQGENSDSPSLHKAFFLSERSRGGILGQKLRLDQGEKMAGVPDSLLAKIKNISIDLTYKQSQLLNKIETKEEKESSLEKIYGEIFSLNRTYNSLIRFIEKNYPSYHQLKYDTKTATIEAVQSQILKKNKVLVEYFLGDSSIYIFTITKDNYDMKKVSMGSLFHFHFNQFRTSLSSPRLTKKTIQSFNQYTSSAYQLYNYLLAPVDNLIEGKDLIIIPGGKLALIPFEALLTNSAQLKGIEYKSLPYVLKTHNVSYANSATTLLNSMKSMRVSKNNGQVLAFSPSFDTKLITSTELDTVRGSLGPLGWTEKEINSLSSYFEVDTYLGKMATEKVFKKNAKQYKIIHIASHGLIDDQNPMNSKIAFTLDEKDTINDGYLHTFELYNTELNAEMAVLSACNTGYGKVQKGEGVMSLGYAFTYAGVPSVVMSHWQVDDKSTYLLMGSFYKYLAKGSSKSEALRKAKLDLLENENIAYANPYYWGAFVVYGDDSPIEAKSNTWVWLLAVLLTISISTLLLYKRKN